MTRIDFYVLTGQDQAVRLDLICKLAEKAVGSRQKVFIHSQSEEELILLDDNLWNFRAMSFVPHALLQKEQQPDLATSEPVILSSGQPDAKRQLLINLAAEVPPFFSRFERTLEIVNEEPPIQTAGRARYRFYKQRGYPLHHHKM